MYFWPMVHTFFRGCKNWNEGGLLCFVKENKWEKKSFFYTTSFKGNPLPNFLHWCIFRPYRALLHCSQKLTPIPVFYVY